MTETSKEIKYYLIKDLNLVLLLRKLINMTEEIREDINSFIETYAPGAKLHNLRTEGNLQIRFMSFEWKFKSIKHIPEKAYNSLLFKDDGVLALPDTSTKKGMRIREEQMRLLSVATADCYELWAQEIAPLLNWETLEEPWLMFNEEKKIYILVLDKARPHGKKSEFRPPLGVVSINKDRADVLMQNMH